MSIMKDDRMRCSTRQNSRACDNSAHDLRKRSRGKGFCWRFGNTCWRPACGGSGRAYREERRKLSEQRRKQRVELERERATIARRIANFLEMVETGLADPKASAQRFNELVGQQREIERTLAEAQSPDKIELHPQAAARYRAKVADIHAAIRSGDPATFEAITLVRDLIDHILVIPTPKPDPVGLEVVGSLAALLSENPQGT